MDEQTFLDIFEGVPQASVSKEDIENGLDMIGALAAKTGFLNSNGEARRALKENAISVNKEKNKRRFYHFYYRHYCQCLCVASARKKRIFPVKNSLVDVEADSTLPLNYTL